jgi:predicted transcriptional regulator
MSEAGPASLAATTDETRRLTV